MANGADEYAPAAAFKRVKMWKTIFFEKNQKNIEKTLDKKKSLWYSIKAVSESDASESERGFAESDRTLKIEQRIDEKEKLVNS